MKRRLFIHTLAAAWLSLTASGNDLIRALSPAREQTGTLSLEQQIERLFTDTASARAVGLIYLARYPDMAAKAASRVQRNLGPEGSGRGGDTGIDLASHCCSDFALGRTVIINGWVLARYEADLCATLVQLTNRHHTHAG